jgi:hypothetical protein
MFRHFTDISGNIKCELLPLYYNVFDGPLPSGKQLRERLEEIRVLLFENKKALSKKGGLEQENSPEDKEGSVNDDENDKKGNVKDNPKDKFFPAYLLAFLAYGPLSIEPYHGWSIAKDDGMGKIPKEPEIAIMSREDLQNAKEEYEKKGSVSDRKTSAKRKEFERYNEVGEGLVEEMRKSRLAQERMLEFQEFERKIASLDKAITLMVELGVPEEEIRAKKFEQLQLLNRVFN